MAKKEFIVYTLADPRTGEVRYVGQTIYSLETRRKRHISDLKACNRKNNWIKSLLSDEVEPIIEELEKAFSIDELDEIEQFWIAYLKFIGCRLVNGTNGGKGCRGFKHSESSLKRLLESRGPTSLETKKKMSLWQKGRNLPKEQKEFISNNMKKLFGKPFKDSLGNIYYSTREAVDKLGLKRSNLIKVLKGKKKSHHGYRFEYINEEKS